MRTIKFRAWDKERKEMLIGAGYSTGQLNNVTLNELEFPEDKVFMQFTGLLDKNGKEIYEGDVVAGIEGIGRKGNAVISFKEGVFGIDGMNFPEGASEYNWTIEEAEIIGNIYQNPELIN